MLELICLHGSRRVGQGARGKETGMMSATTEDGRDIMEIGYKKGAVREGDIVKDLGSWGVV